MKTPNLQNLFSNPLEANAAHNDWAQWAAEGGAGFPALMGAVFFWSVWRVRRFPWGIGVPAFLLHSAVDFPMQIPALSLWFFVILGALAAASKRSPVAAK